MFILLSKVLPPLIMPVGLGLELLLLLVYLIYRGRRRAAGVVLALLVLVVGLPSLPLCADALMGPLEGRYPVIASAAAPTADAIVILGGGTTGRTARQPEVELGSSGGRLLHGFRLLRAGKAPLLILSGGNLLPGDAEAQQMRRILSEWGVPDGDMLLEDRSRNTHENAVETVALARQRGLHRLLLVTSAFHMPRAMAIFHKEAPDLEFIPAPTGQYVPDRRISALSDFLPDAAALDCSTIALRERLGTWVYRRRGWL